jgi:magnesium-transporting ATPase (P-type)
MALLQWLAGVAFLVTGHPKLGLLIWLLVATNAALSYWREYQAQRALSALKDLLPAYARVARAGEDQLVPTRDLVPGDVLVLAEGDNIPADARVVEESGLRANNATLTGEAVPARKTAEASLREDLSEIEKPNLVFAGTSVFAGTGRAVVYATGMLTQFGRIANLTQNVAEGPSLLQKELGNLSRKLSAVALLIGAIVFVVARTEVGLPLNEAIILAIGIIVAVIPEGLVATLTLTLAMGVQRLAQQGVWVKKLSALETLGTTSVICTDKSGTLTQNQMTVRKVWVNRKILNVTGIGYDPRGEIQGAAGDGRADLEALLTAGCLCNNSRLVPLHVDNQPWSCLGDQTEAALLALAVKGGVTDCSRAYPRIHELPFDARRKRMSTIHTCQGQEVAFIKGAPKEVLALCSQIQMGGQVYPLDQAMRAEIMAANDGFARQALRVLALARRNLPPRSGAYTPEGVEKELVFLGLTAMMDPPRPEVARAVEAFRSAGIRMAMITGDYGLTAESLARRVGMVSEGPVKIVTGADLEEMPDEALQNLLADEVIFARMSPDHKLRLVSAYQQHGDVVTVIGDGVNDAPALRKADIGIAMGVTGTDVAREAADVVLTNDDFEKIVSTIAEGRAVYDNLRKFITYIFASNVPEVLPFLLTGLFDIPLALGVIQVLAIDLGTDLLPALALGLEKPEPDMMRRKPRSRLKPLIDDRLLLRSFGWMGMIEAVLCYAGFFLVYYGLRHPAWLNLPVLPSTPAAVSPDQASILAMAVFHIGVVMAQVGVAFACRSEKGNVRWLGLFSNPYLLGGIVFEVGLIGVMVNWHPIAREFGYVPVPMIYWVWLSLYAPVLYGLERARKMLALRFRKE